MMIDSSQATPTTHYSAAALSDVVARPGALARTNASHGAAYRYKRPMRRGPRRGLPLHAAYCSVA